MFGPRHTKRLPFFPFFFFFFNGLTHSILTPPSHSSSPDSLAYPYNFTDTSGVVKMQSQSTGVYAPGEKYSDAGGTRLDSTRPDIALETMRSEQAATGRSTLGATPKGAARPSKSGDIMPAIGGFGSTNAIRFG